MDFWRGRRVLWNLEDGESFEGELKCVFLLLPGFERVRDSMQPRTEKWN